MSTNEPADFYGNGKPQRLEICNLDDGTPALYVRERGGSGNVLRIYVNGPKGRHDFLAGALTAWISGLKHRNYVAPLRHKDCLEILTELLGPLDFSRKPRPSPAFLRPRTLEHVAFAELPEG